MWFVPVLLSLSVLSSKVYLQDSLYLSLIELWDLVWIHEMETIIQNISKQMESGKKKRDVTSLNCRTCSWISASVGFATGWTGATAATGGVRRPGVKTKEVGKQTSPAEHPCFKVQMKSIENHIIIYNSHCRNSNERQSFLALWSFCSWPNTAQQSDAKWRFHAPAPWETKQGVDAFLEVFVVPPPDWSSAQLGVETVCVLAQFHRNGVGDIVWHVNVGVLVQLAFGNKITWSVVDSSLC